MTGADIKLWHDKGYNICFSGVKTKFDQNPDLLNMLKTTAPKLLIESSNDRTWGTGVLLRDTHVLNRDRWHTKGWISTMLMNIRDDNQK